MNYSYDMYKPTKKQVMVPIVVLIVTLVIGGILLLIAKSLGGEGVRTNLIAPGTQVLNLEEPGNYTIYLTTQMMDDKMSYHLPEDFKGLHVELTLNGEAVALTKIEEGYTYGEEGNQSESYLSFDVTEPGEYQLTTSIESNSIPEIVLAVGKTEENLGRVLILSTCALLLILMGVCQFVAYMIFNLGKWCVYYYKTKVI